MLFCSIVYPPLQPPKNVGRFISQYVDRYFFSTNLGTVPYAALASRDESNITRKEYIGSSHILGSRCIPTQRPFPSIMSFFLFERGFHPYVDHCWSTGGSKDIDTNPIS